jgi:hypothetical protein
MTFERLGFHITIAIVCLGLLGCQSSEGVSERQVVDPIQAYQSALKVAFASVDPSHEIAAYIGRLPIEQQSSSGPLLAVESVGLMSDNNLRERYRLLAKALSMSDTSLCAAVGRRTATGQQYAALVGRLDPQSLKSWSTIAVMGILHVVRGAGSRDTLSLDSARAGAVISALGRSLPEPEASRFESALAKETAQLSDADVCWLQVTMYTTASNLADSTGIAARRILSIVESTAPGGTATLQAREVLGVDSLGNHPARASVKTTTDAPLQTDEKRWLIVSQSNGVAVRIDTTNVARTGAKKYQVWEMGSSGHLTLQEIDCGNNRVRLLLGVSRLPSGEQYYKDYSTIVEWIQPEGLGAQTQRGTCSYLAKRTVRPL